MVKVWFIYALQTVETGEFFYVGRAYNPFERLKSHRNPNYYTRQHYPEIDKFFRTQGVIIVELEKNVSSEFALNHEQFWWDHLTEQGWPIRNARPKDPIGHGTSESAKRSAATRRERGITTTNFSSERAQIGAETKRRNGTNVHKSEAYAQSVETKRQKGLLLNYSTPESLARGIETRRRNGTIWRGTSKGAQKAKQTAKERGTDKIGARKAVETKRKNGTLTHSAKSYERSAETVRTIKTIAKELSISYKEARLRFLEDRHYDQLKV